MCGLARMVEKRFAESKDEKVLHEPEALARCSLEWTRLELLERGSEMGIVDDSPQLSKMELHSAVQV